MISQSTFAPLLRKLRRQSAIGEDLEFAIASLPHRIGRVRAQDILVREGEVPSECCLLVEGYAARFKVAANGGRQIVSFHVAGDILDVQHLFLEQADHSVQAIKDGRVVWVPMAPLRALVLNSPPLAVAFWREALTDASIFREWVLNVGRRDAKTRIAHMLCEFIVRCEAAGLGSSERLQVPFTQEEIGDATGLTPVHVNRMLRQLTDEGLISRRGKTLEVRNWSGFREVAGFDKAYLHLAA